MPKKTNTPPSGSAGRKKSTVTEPAAAKSVASKRTAKADQISEADEKRTNLILQIAALLSELLKVEKRKNSNARNEFRYNLDAGHPNYVFEANEETDEWKAVGITHEKETFGKANMPLVKNPKETDTRPAYVRNGVVETGHKNLGRKTMKKMKFSEEDMPNVKSKIRNYKKERKKTKK